MPLLNSPSKAAVGQNIKTEMGAGKSQGQALAIALSTKRRAEKRKKYWEGGEVDNPGEPNAADEDVAEEPQEEPATTGLPGEPKDEYACGGMVGSYAEGGFVIEHSIPRVSTTEHIRPKTVELGPLSGEHERLGQDHTGDMVSLAKAMKKKRGY